MHYPYTALCNWPEPQLQIDWVDQVICIEHWLGQHVGVKGQDWDWVGPEYSPAWLCAVMFQREQDKTMFLLTWGR